MAPRTPATVITAEPGTFVAYLTPDGVLERQIVVGWRIGPDEITLQPQNAIIVGEALDIEREPVILHRSGHVTDFKAAETYEDTSTWFGARGVAPPEAPLKPAAKPEPLGELPADDVKAIAGAVEAYDNPRAHLLTGPGLPGERQVLPGQDNPTHKPVPVEEASGEGPLDLGDMANDPGRVAAYDFSELI